MSTLDELLAQFRSGGMTYDLGSDPVYSGFDFMDSSDPRDSLDASGGGLLKLLSQAGRGGGGGGFAKGFGDTPEEAKKLARRMAMARGYSPQDFRALNSIIERESGWNYRAANPTSTARGIPQAMASVHFGGTDTPQFRRFWNSPRRQIDWLLDYIQGRYGTVQEALAQKNRTGWY